MDDEIVYVMFLLLIALFSYPLWPHAVVDLFPASLHCIKSVVF